MRLFFFLLLLLFVSCKGKKEHHQARAEYMLHAVPVTTEKLALHPPSIRRILDKLDVIGDLKDFYTATNCYSKTLTRLYDLTPDKKPFTNFVIVMPGGSGGEDVRIYSQKDSDYVEIQDFFAFYDTLPGTVHNGFKDVQVNYHNHSPFDFITMNYTWNGKKYIWDKCVAVNDIPYDSLILRNMIDPSKTSESYPWIKWKDGGYIHQK